MYNELDFLSANILNEIELKMEALYQKYFSLTSRVYTPKNWNVGELVYVDDIANIEEALEYFGDGFGYPNGWIQSRNWNLQESNNISYKDINRILNNIEVIDKGNFNPLLPDNNLYPNNELYPTNNKEEV